MRLLPAFLLALAFLLAGCQGKESDAPGHPTETGHQHTPGMTHSPETPTEGGQAGFAAIQEIVATLEDDPTTDWSKVNITALRQHLQDMDS